MPTIRAMNRRLMGLDYGRRRIGVAFCDELGISCTPYGFVSRTDDAPAARVIAALAAQKKAGGYVIGIPYHVSGDAGENVDWVEAFIATLAATSPLPVHRVDERYTSTEAEELLRERGNGPFAPGDVDAKAAALILQRYLAGER